MIWLVFLGLLMILVIVTLVNRNEGYAMLDGSFGGGFNEDRQDETCFTLPDRVYAIHDYGFDAWKCANTPHKEYKRRMKKAERCAREDCSTEECKGACYAMQFPRDPSTDQTALPLMSGISYT